MSSPSPFSWLLNSCIPHSSNQIALSPSPSPSPLSSLPDDLLLLCFSKLPLPSLPSLSLACKRFSLLLKSPSFHLLLRSRPPLHRTLFAFQFSSPHTISSTPIPIPFPPLPNPPSSFPTPHSSFSHPRLATINNSIYIIGRKATLRYDTLTDTFTFRSPTIFPRKKFAAAAIASRIYVSGGTARSSDVEEYNPEKDEWRVVTEAPRKRYGCVGAAAKGVFYVVGGLRVGEVESACACACAGSMDAYHVRAGVWLRVRAVVPGGGCVVGACGVGACVYVLASYAVEVSFWRWEGKGRRGGEWRRLESPGIGGGRVGFGGGGVHFSCVSIGDGKLAAFVEGVGGSYGGRMGLLVYDIERDEWSTGMEVLPGLRRAVCAYVEW